MSEKTYRTMTVTGVAGVVLGIVVLVGGIVCGTLMIISGGRLLRDKSDIIF